MATTLSTAEAQSRDTDQAIFPYGRRTTDTPELARFEADPGAGSDGVYGRFSGDFSWLVGGGVEYDVESEHSRLLAALTLRYFTAVGTYITYRQALNAEDQTDRILSFGVQFEPLFLARWSANAERGPAFWDLTVDSIGVSAGAFFAEPNGRDFGSDKGLELGIGMGVPLLSRADGPWLSARGIVRVSNEQEGFPGFWVTFGWQGFVDLGLAQALDDRR